MYERFTDRARMALNYADLRAKRGNFDSVGTSDLLYGVLRSGGVAACVLDKLVGNRKILDALGQTPAETNSPVTSRLPHLETVKEVIKTALEESKSLGVNHVGTEHLLLGLLGQPETEAGRLLQGFADIETIRQAVFDHIKATPAPADPVKTDDEKLLAEIRSLVAESDRVLGEKIRKLMTDAGNSPRQLRFTLESMLKDATSDQFLTDVGSLAEEKQADLST